MSAPAKVSVIIPCRNERAAIRACLDSIVRSDYPKEYLEIVVVDGGSTDGTRAIVEEYRARNSNIQVVDNPKGTVSAGLNAGIRIAKGSIIIRMDAHTEYSSSYVSEAVAVLERTGADSVGGPWVARGEGYMGGAIALAFQSRFAVGGARGHDPEYEGEVDTVYLGAWRRELFDEIGFFDEELVRNQDDEFNFRLLRSGGRIWQSPTIRSVYQTRPSLRGLFRQYAQYGYWKVRVIQKHGRPASWRHLVPGLWLVGLIGLAARFPFSSTGRWLLATYVGLYAVAAFVGGVVACPRRERFEFIPVLPVVFATYHVAYGYGFLRGVVDFALLRRKPRESFSKMTRDAAPKGEGQRA